MLLPPNDVPPVESIVIDTGGWEPPKELPKPRVVPMALWYLWLAGTSLMAVLFGPESMRFGFVIPYWGIFIGNVLLTPGWAALAIRPLTSHVLSVCLVYVFVMFVPAMRGDAAEIILVLVIVGGGWAILRWCRVFTLDLVRFDGHEFQTPRLAERVQFSLRALILLSAVVALGISLYLFFHESSGWSFYKFMFFIVVPSELLIFWGMLARTRWYMRLPWLLVATHHWILLPIVSRGFVNWNELYDWNQVPEWISIPLSQIAGLILLRWAGYRVGMPRRKERAIPVAVVVEPQSPWD